MSRVKCTQCKVKYYESEIDISSFVPVCVYCCERNDVLDYLNTTKECNQCNIRYPKQDIVSHASGYIGWCKGCKDIDEWLNYELTKMI